MGELKQANLTFKNERSDKVYNVELVTVNSGVSVNFEYGRRGQTLKSGTKTQNAVDLEKGEALFGKLVKEKLKKGYQLLEDKKEFVSTISDTKPSGIECQLLNPIGKEDAGALLRNPAYLLQEKHDGERRLVEKSGSVVRGINKKGMYVSLPKRLIKEFEALNRDFIIDGELIGETFYAFDALEVDKTNLRPLSAKVRIATLYNLGIFNTQIIFSKTAFSQEDKKALIDAVFEERGEGVVFKDVKSTYQAGRPNSGGTQLKYKFYKTASFIVSGVNSVRSVGICLYDGNETIKVGNVTIPSNKEVPNAGEIIEVRYLYAFEGGSVYQPTYKMARTDVAPEECQLTQLVYKRA